VAVVERCHCGDADEGRALGFGHVIEEITGFDFRPFAALVVHVEGVGLFKGKNDCGHVLAPCLNLRGLFYTKMVGLAIGSDQNN
jgi:hypothetical protein